jgi:hypothetical protein
MTDTNAPDHFVWFTPSREEWLRQAAIKMTAWLAEIDLTFNPATMPVSVGFPKIPHGKGKAIGVCHVKGACPTDETLRPVFICPTLADPVMEVLPTLLHEMVHAALPAEVGHKAPFAKAMVALGLAGKPTHTYLEPESPLHTKMLALAADLGHYPHVAMADRQKPKKKGWPRYRSVNEPSYKVIVSLDALDEFGPPLDPWGDEMEPCRVAPIKVKGGKTVIETEA